MSKGVLCSLTTMDTASFACALRGDKFEARESARCMKIATARNVSVFLCRSKVLRVDSTAVVEASYFRAREA